MKELPAVGGASCSGDSGVGEGLVAAEPPPVHTEFASHLADTAWRRAVPVGHVLGPFPDHEFADDIPGAFGVRVDPVGKIDLDTRRSPCRGPPRQRRPGCEEPNRLTDETGGEMRRPAE